MKNDGFDSKLKKYNISSVQKNSNPYGNSAPAQRSANPYGGSAPASQNASPWGSPTQAQQHSGWNASGTEMKNVADAYAADSSKGHSNEHRKVLGELFRLTPAVGAVYCLMALVAGAGFFFISDGELSAILVLAALLTTMSHMFVLLEIVLTKSTESVNVPSMILLAIVYAARLPALCFADQYLPVDSTGTLLSLTA